MKKAYIILISLLITALLAGCQRQDANIEVANLTESEKELIRAVGVERYFAFDIDISNSNFDQFEYKVNYYENGRFIKTLSNGMASEDFFKKEKQRLIWSHIRTGKNQDEVWVVAFAGSRVTQPVTLSKNIRGMSWGNNELINTINPGEEIILAALVGTESGEIRNIGIIFDKEEGGINALENYDVAYVLSIIVDEDLPSN